MRASARSALPHPPPQKVDVPGEFVPPFDRPVSESTSLTIAPPIVNGRGEYVSNVNAPMAAGKSAQSRPHAWKGGITAVVTFRISYALNALQGQMSRRQVHVGAF